MAENSHIHGAIVTEAILHMETESRTNTLDEWSRGSAFLLPSGKPRVWYHGTDVDEPFNVFARNDEASIGYHFGELGAAQARLDIIFRHVAPEDRGGGIIPVYCRAANPLRLRDMYTWDQYQTACALAEAGVIADEEIDFVADTWSSEGLFAAVEEAGYDAIVYQNDCEDGEAAADSLIVWRPELVKSVYACHYPRDDARLSPAFPASLAETQLAGAVAASMASNREALRIFRAENTPAARGM